MALPDKKKRRRSGTGGARDSLYRSLTLAAAWVISMAVTVTDLSVRAMDVEFATLTAGHIPADVCGFPLCGCEVGGTLPALALNRPAAGAGDDVDVVAFRHCFGCPHYLDAKSLQSYSGVVLPKTYLKRFPMRAM